MTSRLALILALASAGLPALARAESPAPHDVPATASLSTQDSLFDPARHMHVSEVRPGMTGYGLTVFKGTKIEKFDVKVLSILKNFNPQHDVVLIQCEGDYLKHTGSVAGMSGSPIFLKDDEGQYRMIGAFAYGWPLTKDPVAGVQPIEYMLKLPVGRNWSARANSKPTTQPDGAAGSEPIRADRHSGLSWSLTQAGMVPFWKPLSGGNQAEPTKGLDAGSRLGENAPQLEQLATPLMTGGLSPSVLKQVAPLFARYGLTALQSGGGGSASPDEAPAKLEPGAALAVPLLSGDVDMTAIGTVTENIGGRIFGFGHPFNNEGPVQLPLGSGTIHGVIANLQTSFKLGALTKDCGELTTDESVGVAGELGHSAPTIPIEFNVRYADGSTRAYHFQAAQHPKFTPMIAGAALAAAVTGPSELPQYNTVRYQITLQFANGQSIDIQNTAANANAQELFGEIGLPLQAAMENPFERVPVKRITGTMSIDDDANLAQILDVNVPRSKYRPGETVKAYVTYKPFREPEGILPIEMELPRDLPQGTYQLIISDAQRYFQDMQQSEPFRFTADSIGDVFGVLKDVAAIRQNAVYLRLIRQPDGVAVGRVALPDLPSSRRQILLGAGRSNITPFVSSTVKTVPTERVMTGSAQFAITVDPKAKVEVAGPRPSKAEPAAAPIPAGKRDEHRKPATAEPAPPPPPAEDQPKDKKED
ncbi:MAG TPA: hypothetical protein VGI81_20195 [Tepidisphaeraceae bacterium]